MAHIDVRDLGRVRTITAVLVRHGFGSLLSSWGLIDGHGDAPEPTSPWAARLRQVLVELGPTFVKIGQVLSVRPDIIPRALVQELRTLQDDVPAAPRDEVHALIEAELRRPLAEVFESFDEAPVASASIAQVHLAVTRDGARVAVKVQRPDLADVIRSDLHILYTLAHLIEGRVDLPGVYTPVAIVQELEQAIRQELDFLQEAQAAERFARDFRGEPRVVVPGIVRSLSSARLLVMTRVEGRPLSALSAGDPEVGPTVQLLVDATMRQVFDHGFFHADPHPGNLRVLPDGKLAWLDFGLCGTLTAEMRDTLIELLSALVFRDADTLALTIYRVGGVEGQVDLRAFRGEVERLMQRYEGASLSELGATATLLEFVELAARYRIRLVPEYALLARAASILDGVLRGLDPGLDPVEVVRPHVSRLLTQRLNPERMAADALRVLAQARGGLRELPLQLNQLMLDLERGRLVVNTRAQDGEEQRALLRDLSLRLTLAISSAAALVAGGLLLAAWDPRPAGLPLAGALGLMTLLAAATLHVGLLMHLALGEQLRLSRLRRRLLGLLRFFTGR